jgi:hypothetical protein
MPKPSWNTIDARIDQIIAADKGYHPCEIHDNDKLRGDLGYDDLGLKALAPDINKAFFNPGKGLSGNDIVRCLKVIGIVALIDDHPAREFK